MDALVWYVLAIGVLCHSLEPFYPFFFVFVLLQGANLILVLFDLTFVSCLEEIKRLDSDELYMKKLSTPLLKGNVIPPWLTFEHLAKQIIQVWDFHKMLKH